jgi:hypothetical protein
VPEANDWNAQTIADFRANAGRVGGGFAGYEQKVAGVRKIPVLALKRIGSGS